LFYDPEFGLLSDTLKKRRVLITCTSGNDLFFGRMSDFESFVPKRIFRECTIFQVLGAMKPKTVYFFEDHLSLSYMAFLLSHREMQNVVIIGPYRHHVLQSQQILEISERNGVSPKFQRAINEFFASVPILPENSSIFLLIDSFCERMWRGPYEVSDRSALPISEPVTSLKEEAKDIDDTFLTMKNMERRYALENELMDAVMLGSQRKVNQFFSGLTEAAFEKRVADPLRNLKNYSIIMNTLLRKAAERGGVHPMYLDRISSEFALRIEMLPSTQKAHELMEEMFRSYCSLVNKHSSKAYSSLVEKAVIAIESDSAAEMSLHILAERLNVSSGYLSSLFKEETGKTVTSYIRDKRMSYAAYLLRTTKLQIQTVAQHCGIMDVQYFSKLFKQYTGKTPSEFRTELSGS